MIIAINILLWILVLTGFAGIFLPVLPGILLIYIAGIIFAIINHNLVILPMFLLTILWLMSIIVDFLGSYWGAKKFGATKYGSFLSPIGAILGLILGSFIGMLIGALMFAFIGELIFARKNIRLATKSGLGAIIGIVTSQIINAMIAIIMIILIVNYLA